MASSYSTDLKLELMVTGENAGTWGDKTNTNLNLLQQAIAGFESVTLSSGATTALTMSDAALSNARNMVIKFATITAGASTVATIPDGIEKFYIFDCTLVTNPTNLTIKTASGTGFSPDAQKIYAAYSDGTNLIEVSLDSLGGTIGSAQIADNAVITSKISNANVTTAKIADNAITTAKISALQVTSAKIANDAVGADQLADTAVTAGPYTTANITVDAQGRITAASSGAGGDGSYFPRITDKGPNSGNITTPANASKYYAFAVAGGGGGGGGRQEANRAGAPGGAGGFGFYSGNVQASTPYSYSVGGPGGGGSTTFSGTPNPGNSGGNTNVTGLLTVNAGGGGTAAPPSGPTPGGASPGNQPGASRTNQSRDYILYGSGAPGTGGQGAFSPNNGPVNNGQSGGSGHLTFYDDGGQ